VPATVFWAAAAPVVFAADASALADFALSASELPDLAVWAASWHETFQSANVLIRRAREGARTWSFMEDPEFLAQ